MQTLPVIEYANMHVMVQVKEYANMHLMEQVIAYARMQVNIAGNSMRREKER
jgi:hypothetical protein